MKKKVLTVLSMLLLLVVVGFFQFLDVNATKQESASNLSHNVPERVSSVLGKTIDSETAFLLTPAESEGEEATKVVAVVSEPEVETTAEENINKLPDSIDLFGETYERVSDEKFALYINVANEIGAGFYAIPNSDVFAIAKDGEVLFQMSSGIKAVPIANMELLVGIFAKSGEFNEVGTIEDDIRKVASTGETISVEGPNYTSYSVFIQDGWILVSF